MKTLALLLAALLAGCAAQDSSPFRPGETGTVDSLTVILQSPTAVDGLCRAGYPDPALAPPHMIEGCQRRTAEGERLIIAPVPVLPSDPREACILGHELLHAAFGIFHAPADHGWRC